ncbi:MAG: type II secretion system F family protein [Syntrophales bacterium]
MEGFVEAIDYNAAIEKLKISGNIPLKVLPVRKGKRDNKSNIRQLKSNLQLFTGELSVLLDAGLPLDRSLNILSDIFENEGMREVIRSILKSIREGKSFSEALQNHPHVFPKLYINMIRAGEVSGVLHIVLDKLNEYLASTKELKEHIFSAMIYPAVLLATGILSIIVLIAFVIPRFSAIFTELGASLPLPTKILLAVSSTIQSYWWIILLIAASGWILLTKYIKTEKGRYWWDELKLRVLKDVIIELETERFFRTLGTLLKSGVPLIQAIQNARDVIGNEVVVKSLEALSKRVKEGKGMAGPLSETKIFPSLALSMVKVGEETGQLDNMLLKVASIYEKNLKETIKRFISLLEPIMILSMGFMIGFIVISILMAIFSITDLPM